MKKNLTRSLVILSLVGSLVAVSGCSHSEVKTNEEAPAASQRAAAQAPLKLDMVHFDVNSSELSDEAKDVLKKNAEILAADPSLNFQIQGFCDERGGEKYNLALGNRRAKAVRAYLTSQGIQAERISIATFGKSNPVDDHHSEAAYSKNRRAAFWIHGDEGIRQ